MNTRILKAIAILSCNYGTSLKQHVEAFWDKQQHIPTKEIQLRKYDYCKEVFHK